MPRYFILEYGYDTLVIQAQEAQHALDLYNESLREENEKNRWVYPDQIDGGGKKQSRSWKQFVPIERDSVSITEIVENEEHDGIFFKREGDGI